MVSGVRRRVDSNLLAVQPPPVAALPEGIKRPRWSVMFPVFNCANYLREALQSVLRQDPGENEMQIEVIDNCSTKDDPEAVVWELGRGRVQFHRQPQNIGPIRNFNTCIDRARGEWVHILHGDDMVETGFYSRAWNGLSVGREVGAALCRVMHIDENGRPAYYGRHKHLSELEEPRVTTLGPDFVEQLFVNQRIQFAGMVVRRSTYELVGGFRPELVHCSDWDMWIRIALATHILYEPKSYAYFRIHSGADSAAQIRSGQDVVDKRRAIMLASTYVPPRQARQHYKCAMKAASIEAIARARRLWRTRDRLAALRQLQEALRCSVSPSVVFRLAHFWVFALAKGDREGYAFANDGDDAPALGHEQLSGGAKDRQPQA